MLSRHRHHLPNILSRPVIGFQEEGAGDNARPGSVQVQVVSSCVPNRSVAGWAPDGAQATPCAGEESEGPQEQTSCLVTGDHLAVVLLLLCNSPAHRLPPRSALQRLEQPLRPLGPSCAALVPMANEHRRCCSCSSIGDGGQIPQACRYG
jgi:hypothetical protein